MIGPPGLPKAGRRTSSSARSASTASVLHLHLFKWAAGFYVAGVLAHFGHHMAFDLPSGADPSLGEALSSAPLSLVWPADLIGTLINLT